MGVMTRASVAALFLFGSAATAQIYGGHAEGGNRDATCAAALADAKSKLGTAEKYDGVDQPCSCSENARRSSTTLYCTTSILAKTEAPNPRAGSSTGNANGPLEVVWFVTRAKDRPDAVSEVHRLTREQSLAEARQRSAAARAILGSGAEVQARGSWGTFPCAGLIRLPDGRIQERWGTTMQAARTSQDNARKNGNAVILAEPLCR